LINGEYTSLPNALFTSVKKYFSSHFTRGPRFTGVRFYNQAGKIILASCAGIPAMNVGALAHICQFHLL
jgi:chloramphenicol O-acetyltransferase